MPQNEEANQRFGFYKDLCLRDEAVVLERKPFPDGPKHPCRTTVLEARHRRQIVRRGKRSDFGPVLMRFSRWRLKRIGIRERQTEHVFRS